MLNTIHENEISPVDFRIELQHSRIKVLKMDCEGCEYALVNSMALSDPLFLDHVEQFVVSVHLSQKWIHVRNLGLLYHFLFQSGFKLIHAVLAHCDPLHEATGCSLELLRINYPCTKHCHNYLFARYPLDVGH